MKIKFKQPEDEKCHRTHVCVWVDAGALQGYQYLTLSEAANLLNQLQQAIWHAEAPVPEEE